MRQIYGFSHCAGQNAIFARAALFPRMLSGMSKSMQVKN